MAAARLGPVQQRLVLRQAPSLELVLQARSPELVQLLL